MQRTKIKDKNTVRVMVIMPESVKYNGDVGKPNYVAVRRNKLRCPGLLTYPMLLYALCSMLCALCLLGCGYTLHGKTALPFDSIQIGRIENVTTEPKLQDELYKSLTEEFLKQGITVSPVSGYKLSGKINHFELRIISEKKELATEYEVIVRGDFRLVEPSGVVKEFKNIGSPFIVSFQSSDILEDVLASKEKASENALKDLASEIVAHLIYSEE